MLNIRRRQEPVAACLWSVLPCRLPDQVQPAALRSAIIEEKSIAVAQVIMPLAQPFHGLETAADKVGRLNFQRATALKVSLQLPRCFEVRFFTDQRQFGLWASRTGLRMHLRDLLVNQCQQLLVVFARQALVTAGRGLQLVLKVVEPQLFINDQLCAKRLIRNRRPGAYSNGSFDGLQRRRIRSPQEMN